MFFLSRTAWWVNMKTVFETWLSVVKLQRNELYMYSHMACCDPLQKQRYTLLMPSFGYPVCEQGSTPKGVTCGPWFWSGNHQQSIEIFVALEYTQVASASYTFGTENTGQVHEKWRNTFQTIECIPFSSRSTGHKVWQRPSANFEASCTSTWS